MNILSGDNPKQSRWKFIVEDELYGKLTCSYDLEKDFVDGLDVFFSDVIAEPKGRRSVVNLNHVLMCREEAVRLLREKIERNIQDAMEGLIYEVRLEVLRKFNERTFFIDFNATEVLKTIRRFYLDRVNDRANAHQGKGQSRAAFLRKIIPAYARAAEKANNEVTAAVRVHKNLGLGRSVGRYGIRLEEWRLANGKQEFYGKVTKAALARELQLAGHRISQSVLSRQMKRYEIELSDLEKAYDDERFKRQRG